MLGLQWDSYEAYCLDEAVIFFGLQVEAKLESAGHKESKEERKLKRARETVMDKIFGKENAKKQAFADPATMFN